MTMTVGMTGWVITRVSGHGCVMIVTGHGRWVWLCDHDSGHGL